jgi:hypothetical protein
MNEIDNLKDQEQQYIVNFIKKLHSFLADGESNKLGLKEGIKTCHELTKGKLDWYKKENKAIGYCEMSQSYKSMMKSSIELLEHCDKGQLKDINVTANLFRLQLITDEGKIKPEIEKLTKNLSDFNQWKNEGIAIFKDAIFSILNKFRDKPEILFELVKLVALVKSMDKNNKLDSFYLQFSTNLGSKADESKETLYVLWKNAWKEDDRFFSPSN